MTTRRSIAALVAIATLAAACTTSAPAGSQTDLAGTDPGTDAPTDAGDDAASASTDADGWVLVWEDEFDGPVGTPPDPRWWTHEVGGDGWGNQELQYYVDGGHAAAQDGDGHLVITAAEAAAPDGTDCWYGECRYTSARITTRDNVEVEYGRIEVRAKLPVGDGTWPAFWMLGTNIDLKGWPNAGEIDVMEHIGRQPAQVHGTVHGPTYSGADGIGGSHRFDGALPSEGFHTYAIEWEPDRIRWYVDDLNYATLLPSLLPKAERWVFDHPFFLILNLAIGGQWPGDPTPDTTFPQQFVVDNVRVLTTEEPSDG